MSLNESMLADVFQVLAALGNVPVMLMGDFNVRLDTSSAIQRASWIDACKSCAASQDGSEPDPTCFVCAASEGTQIDGILANTTARGLLGEAGLVLDSVLPTHCPVAVELRLGDCSRQVLCVSQPKRIPLTFGDPDPDAEACVADRVCRQVLHKSFNAWATALAAKCVEQLWVLWCSDAETYLCNRARLAGCEVDEKRCRGRGQVRFVKRRIGMPLDAEGGARSVKASKLGKLKRQLVDLLRQVAAYIRFGTYGAPAYVLQHLWDKCRRVGAYLVPEVSCASIWQCVSVPCSEDLNLLINCVTSVIQSQQAAARAERMRVWKDKFVANWQDGGSRVYRWCKGEENERADMISRPDGSLTCDSDEMDRLVRDAWLPIFQMYKHQAKPSWKQFHECFGSFFPPRVEMHADRPTGEQLRAALMRMRSTSAPGCDGWRVDELKRLPVQLLDRLADLLDVVEENGVWPAALCEGIVSLITKGEGTSPLKLRPIGVMSVIYRLWASTRASQVLVAGTLD